MNKKNCWKRPPYPRLEKTFILIYVVQSCNKIPLLKTWTDVSIVFLWYKMIMHKAGCLLNLMLGFYFLILEEDGVPIVNGI